ncbi:hypothetical protein [Propionivibrio limicola]|uniref:hypothetical protein n=1 Tax=Propionivibrio limicola TaxID=167645 RepID=UPI001290A1C3|nr:hypothetical protein [Propionivibrio limicola]
MKHLLIVAAFATVLASLPAQAQLGPAGVPGAPGLVPPSATKPAAKTEPKAKVATPSRSTKAAAKQKASVEKKSPLPDCSKTAEPERCERHQKARQLCSDKEGDAHLQCLRDTLVPNK